MSAWRPLLFSSPSMGGPGGLASCATAASLGLSVPGVSPMSSSPPPPASSQLASPATYPSASISPASVVVAAYASAALDAPTFSSTFFLCSPSFRPGSCKIYTPVLSLNILHKPEHLIRERRERVQDEFPLLGAWVSYGMPRPYNHGSPFRW